MQKPRRNNGQFLSQTPVERFFTKFRVASSGCWVWTAALNTGGYGVLKTKAGGPNILAHRFSYETFVGPIPDDKELDHLCRNRACVNPKHLEPVTRLENVTRGDGPEIIRRVNATKTHCPHGHPYDSENTRIRRSGGRACRACERERLKSRRAQQGGVGCGI